MTRVSDDAWRTRVEAGVRMVTRKQPQTKKDIIQAMVEALTWPRACEKQIGENRLACVLCGQNVAAVEVNGIISYPMIEHGPYCPITLAYRLRRHEYVKKVGANKK